MALPDAFDAVLLAGDSRVHRPMGVVLGSLRRVRTDPTRVFIFHDGMTDDLAEALRQCAGANITLEPIRVPDSALTDELLPPHLPRAALFRLLAGELLPAEVARLLYLDTDVVLLDDPGEIAFGASGCAVCAVRDPFRPWIGGPPPLPWRELGLDPRTHYFNSGVMLIDLERWRSDLVAERSLELLQKYRLPFADQCALNLVLHGEWEELHPRWNVQVAHQLGDKSFAWACEEPSLVEAALASPGIVHFTGTEKPWHTGPGELHRSDWYEVLDTMTPWPGWRPQRPRPDPFHRRLLRRAGRALMAKS